MPKELPLFSWGNSWKGLAAKGRQPGAPSHLEEKWIITGRESRGWITAWVTVHLCAVWAYFFINISRDSNYRILMVFFFPLWVKSIKWEFSGTHCSICHYSWYCIEATINTRLFLPLPLLSISVSLHCQPALLGSGWLTWYNNHQFSFLSHYAILRPWLLNLCIFHQNQAMLYLEMLKGSPGRKLISTCPTQLLCNSNYTSALLGVWF